jgi:hypothetical protein
MRYGHLMNSYYTIFYYVLFGVIYYYHHHNNYDLDKDFIKEMEFNIALMTFLIMGTILTMGYDKWLYALFMWNFWFIMITHRGNELSYNTLSIPLILFFSEYYEIPIFIYKIMINQGYRNDIVMIMIKIFMIIPIIFMLEKMKYNSGRFIRNLILFSIIYIPIAYIFYLVYMTEMFILIILKLWCLLFVMYELFQDEGLRKWTL